MNPFKEIYVDFESNTEIKPEDINFTKESEFKTRQSIDVGLSTGTKGINVSLPNLLIFG